MTLATPLTLFVPGSLKNSANAGGYYGGFGEASYRKRWRDNTTVMAMAARNARPWPDGFQRVPKRVHMHALVWNLFDAHDGLRNALKPLPDGLIRARIIHADDTKSGHVFEYTQELVRTPKRVRGVQVTITQL